MASNICFAKIATSELEALKRNPKLADGLDWASGPNHRQFEMFHYVLTGSTTDKPGTVANLFSGDCGDDIIDLSSTPSSAASNDDVQAVSELMARLERAEKANDVEAIAKLGPEMDALMQRLGGGTKSGEPTFSELLVQFEQAQNANDIEAVDRLNQQIADISMSPLGNDAGSGNAQPLSALAPDCLPAFSSLLTTINVDTARARWQSYCAMNGLDHVDEDADHFHEVLTDLKSLCGTAMAEQSTIVFTWG